MTKMPGEGDIDTQHNGGQVCGQKIISLGVEGFEPETIGVTISSTRCASLHLEPPSAAENLKGNNRNGYTIYIRCLTTLARIPSIKLKQNISV